MNNFRDKSRGLTGLHTALEGLLSTIEQIPVGGGGGGGSATDSNFIDWVGRVAISTLTTTAKTVKGAINELKNGVDDALSNTENLDSAIGDITTLVTSDKSNVVAAINEVATDYIVEQGTSGIWTYRKWSSGVAECWLHSSLQKTVTASSLMSGYYTNITDVKLPTNLFNSTPSLESVRGAIGNGIGFGDGVARTTTDLTLSLWGNQSATTATVKYIKAIGTWK